MQIATDEFKQRISEIDKYFNFLEKVETDYRLLAHLSNGEVYKIDDDHLKIFRANGFLILYNLVESTVANCVAAIFDEISTKEKNGKKVSYKDVNSEVKKYWLKNIYNHGDKIKKETVVNQLHDIFERILADASLQIIKNEMDFGGNLDTKKIREVAENLGIRLSNDHYEENLHGKVLLHIKNHRNDLAHGAKSFMSIGRDVTYSGDGLDGKTSLGLFHFKKYTIEHLESFILDIQKYVADEKYFL